MSTMVATTSQAAPTKGAAHVHSTWNATLRTALGAALAVTLVLLAFAWPTYTAKPKETPLGVVATAQQRPAIDEKLAASGGVFTPLAYPDRAAAVQAIQQRTAYGAIVLPATPAEPTEILTASAASPAVTQALGHMAQQMGSQQLQAAGTAKQEAAAKAAQLGAQAAAAGASAETLKQLANQLAADPATAARATAMQPQIAAAEAKAKDLSAQSQNASAALSAPTPGFKVTDVAPLSAKDSRGTGLALAGLPLAMGGMIGGVLISMLVVGWKRRLAAVTAYGVLGGLALTLILHTWFGFVSGSFATMWLVLAAALAATAAFISGAHALLGRVGIALGAIVTMFIGNPISSLQMPKEWLPGPWGEIGQYFVPGSAGTLMRNVSYFPDASTLQPWLVLAGWLVLGMILTLAGHHKDDEVVHIDGATVPDAA